MYTWEAVEANETFLEKKNKVCVESRESYIYSRGKKVEGKIVP